MAEKKTELISFRLTKSEFKPYKQIIETTSLSKTEFFRKIFLSGKYEFHVNECKPKEYKKIIFLLNKSSNNLNQLARKLNQTHKTGIVSESLYKETLNRLISIESLMKRVIDDN